MGTQFVWTDELSKEFCEFVGLRVKGSQDIREQINYLQEDFKKLHAPKKSAVDTVDKEKDYEILSFSYNTGKNNIAFKASNGYFFIGEHCIGDTKDMLTTVWKIHSVKRLSDNSIWMAGKMTIYGKIVSIKLVDGTLIFEIENEMISYLYPIYLHELMEPLKERKIPILKPAEHKHTPVLLRTIDGYEWRGEEIELYYIKPKSFEIIPILSINYWLQENCKKGDVVDYPINKWFHSKKEAETYVMWREEKYSLNDISKASIPHMGKKLLDIEELKQLKK